MTDVEIVEHDPSSLEAIPLLEELSVTLAKLTGRDGKSSFALQDVRQPRSTFLLALREEEPVGCGALRPIDGRICEIKRMYTRYRSAGIGSQILAALEERAREFGYHSIWLETGKENEQAINFYLKRGYQVRENFGLYRGRSECICLEKQL